MADLAAVPKDEVARLAEALYRDHPNADSIYIPAPHWGTIDIVETLERELGVAVITGVQAIVWETLHRCGVDDRIDGHGRLLWEH